MSETFTMQYGVPPSMSENNFSVEKLRYFSLGKKVERRKLLHYSIIFYFLLIIPKEDDVI